MNRKIIYGCGISQEQREINNKIYNELYPMFKYATNNDYSNEDLSKYVVFSDLGLVTLITVIVYIVTHTTFQTMKLR